MGDVRFSHPRRVKAAAHASEFPPAAAVVCSHLKCLECPRRSRRPNNCCHSENMFLFIYLFSPTPPPPSSLPVGVVKKTSSTLEAPFRRWRHCESEWWAAASVRFAWWLLFIYRPTTSVALQVGQRRRLRRKVFSFSHFPTEFLKRSIAGIFTLLEKERDTLGHLLQNEALAMLSLEWMLSFFGRVMWEGDTKSHLLTMLRIRAAAVRWCSGHYATLWEFQKAFWFWGMLLFFVH